MRRQRIIQMFYKADASLNSISLAQPSNSKKKCGIVNFTLKSRTKICFKVIKLCFGNSYQCLTISMLSFNKMLSLIPILCMFDSAASFYLPLGLPALLLPSGCV